MQLKQIATRMAAFEIVLYIAKVFQADSCAYNVLKADLLISNKLNILELYQNLNAQCRNDEAKVVKCNVHTYKDNSRYEQRHTKGGHSHCPHGGKNAKNNDVSLSDKMVIPQNIQQKGNIMGNCTKYSHPRAHLTFEDRKTRLFCAASRIVIACAEDGSKKEQTSIASLKKKSEK